jgi:putative peptidoglycan lipid II flippase
MLVAHPLATLFFQYGKFDANSARLTGDMILCYGSGVWAYCGLLILQRGFYAAGDRLTPMYVGMAATVVNVVLNLTLIWPLGARGLSLSTALVATCQCALSCLLLQRRTGSLDWAGILRTAVKTIVAVSAMSVVCLLLAPGSHDGGLQTRALKLAIPLGLGFATFFTVAWLIGLREPGAILFHRGQFRQGLSSFGSSR